MATALVTGGNGFIGSYVVRELLSSGWDVVTLDLQPAGKTARYVLGSDADRVSWILGSVDDADRVAEAVSTTESTAIVHIAAVVNPVALATDPLLALNVNLAGTVNVLDAARRHGTSQFIYFSSIGALPTIQYEPVDASHPVLLAREGPGAGFYGASKVASEAFALAYAEAFDLDVRIVRPSAVYGLGMQWPIYIKPMVEGAARGEPVSFRTGGSFPRDYTHVADVASLVIACLNAHPDHDRIFYAATGHPLVTAAEIATIIRELVPGADIEIGAELSDADRVELRYRGQLSIDNAREQLGWEPRFGDVRAGVAEYLESYRTFLGHSAPP